MNSTTAAIDCIELESRLRAIRSAISTPQLQAQLAEASPEMSDKFAEHFLAISAFYDDSISVPLGTIFDRSEESPVRELHRSLARAYGVLETFTSTTGTSAANSSAVMTLGSDGDVVGVVRDCHVSVVGGVVLAGLTPIYLQPMFDTDLGVMLPVTQSEVAAFLDRHPEITSFIVTLPTYNGLMGDVAGIIFECHQRGVRVMVDGAHGPHLRFLGELGFPVPAEMVGADIVTQSTHKVLSALSQGSLVHINNPLVADRYAEIQALGFQSTSFSFPILLSIEHAVRQMLGDGTGSWKRAVDRATSLREGATNIPGIVSLDQQVVEGLRVVGYDPTRVTLNIRRTGITGYQAADELARHGLIVEMATVDTLLFLVGPGVTNVAIDATLDVLVSIVRSKHRENRQRLSSQPPPRLPPLAMSPRTATQWSHRERVPVDASIGRVSAETVGCYPPGQPILVVGELITPEAVEYLRSAVASGAHLKRTRDDNFRTLQVLIE